ncbi:MAG: hypothetical protein U9R00_00870 [Patescibacteria group bacterium]|nr:hypothetical protein [Patescibacteria group bacterium]
MKKKLKVFLFQPKKDNVSSDIILYKFHLSRLFPDREVEVIAKDPRHDELDGISDVDLFISKIGNGGDFTGFGLDVFKKISITNQSKLRDTPFIWVTTILKELKENKRNEIVYNIYKQISPYFISIPIRMSNFDALVKELII